MKSCTQWMSWHQAARWIIVCLLFKTEMWQDDGPQLLFSQYGVGGTQPNHRCHWERIWLSVCILPLSGFTLKPLLYLQPINLHLFLKLLSHFSLLALEAVFHPCTLCEMCKRIERVGNGERWCFTNVLVSASWVWDHYHLRVSRMIEIAWQLKTNSIPFQFWLLTYL